MNEWKKTCGFVVVSGIVVGLAFATHSWTKPRMPKEFEKVGQLFFDDFDPAEATLLEVTAIPNGSTEAKSFRVEYKDGMWRIPTHHGYPAEAKERLAKTASSLIGIVRESLAGRRESDHNRFSVNDPSESGAKDPKTVGQKISLKNAGGDVLAEFIIGRRAEKKTNEEDIPNVRLLDEKKEKPLYYVRRPDEKETYKARLNVKISTNFSDWIDQDLLKVGDANFQDLTTTIHGFKEVNRGGFLLTTLDPSKSEINHLTKSGFGPWNLDGLDSKKEQLNTGDVDRIVSGLKDLKIVGVRPKPKYKGNPILTSDFKINISKNTNRREFQDVLSDFSREMASMGFHLAESKSKDPLQTKLISQNGEIVAATDQGLVYRLYFGDVVVGNEKEIEIGAPHAKKANSKKPSNKKSNKTKKTDETVKTNRYLYLNVTFDEKYVPDNRSSKPQKPVEPKKPSAPAKKKTAPKIPKKTGKNDPGEKDDHRFVSFHQESKKSQKQTPKKKPPIKQSKKKKELTPQKKYERAMSRYRGQLQQYQADRKRYQTSDEEYQDKLSKGKKKSKELNERFQDWYYVISAKSLKDLRVHRKDLVKLKPKPKALVAPRPRSAKEHKKSLPKAKKKN